MTKLPPRRPLLTVRSRRRRACCGHRSAGIPESAGHPKDAPYRSLRVASHRCRPWTRAHADCPDLRRQLGGPATGTEIWPIRPVHEIYPMLSPRGSLPAHRIPVPPRCSGPGGCCRGDRPGACRGRGRGREYQATAAPVPCAANRVLPAAVTGLGGHGTSPARPGTVRVRSRPQTRGSSIPGCEADGRWTLVVRWAITLPVVAQRARRPYCNWLGKLHIADSERLFALLVG